MRPRQLLCALAVAALAALAQAQAQPTQPARVKLLAFNDFHGQLGPGRELSGRPVGSAAVLGAYLRAAAERAAGAALILHAGDFVGGSPWSSSLLQDEPAIAFLNLLANEHCRGVADTRCNVIGTLGNHEFDEGVPELLRLLRGGVAREGVFLERPWRGSRALYVCANVLDRKRDRPLLPPYAIQRVAGVRIGVIGAVLSATPNIVLAEGVREVRFADERSSINRAVSALRGRGVRAIVVVIHHGAGMIPYEGPTRSDVGVPDSEFREILAGLDPEVDVVASGHAHQFANAYYRDGTRDLLVTQAYSAGIAYADIDLTVDRSSGEVIEKSAQIVPTYADEGPGAEPVADIAALALAADEHARSILAESVGYAPEPISDVPNTAGESPLGNLVADAERLAMGSQIALVNQGSLRAALPAGPVTVERLLAVHPFGSVLVAMDLSGAQIRRVLEQQWEYSPPHMLQVAGLEYSWDAALPIGRRVLAIRVAGAPLRDDVRYRVTVNDFLGRGGGGFPLLAEGANRAIGPRVTEALRAFIAASGGTARARIEARIVRRD